MKKTTETREVHLMGEEQTPKKIEITKYFLIKETTIYDLLPLAL